MAQRITSTEGQPYSRTTLLSVPTNNSSNPKQGLTLVPGQAITLAAYQHRGLKTSAIAYYDVDYTLSFLFKDGKIRINSPTFNAQIMNYNGTWNKMDVKKFYFKGNGNPKREKSHQFVNAYFNGLIKSILEKSTNIDNWKFIYSGNVHAIDG
ncbi:hypothetical protein ACLCDV_10735 [Sphingobacterium sp. Lzh-3]|uniref:hypothetical protein n=1 Tax=Sphingobacterium sp. Lzh-3 TaxID=3382150 RepID=UPI00398CCFF1